MVLQSKELFLKTLNELINIGKKCEIDIKESEDLRFAVEKMPLLVPVVGEFSSGKSSLLNKYLGKKILPVGITPETAIPAELYYSETEYDEGVYADGKIEKITDISSAVGKCVCVRRYINSEFLKNIQPIILVDMPGFDSPLDTHNKAIFNYLDKGCHYIVITPVDAGTISSSMKKQIQNILSFNKDCTFFVSKTDLKSDEENNEVCEEISSGLELIMGYRPKVTKLNQQDISLFNSFINSLDPDLLVKKQFIESIKDECFNLKNSLNTKISALKNNKEKNKRAIEELKESLDRIKAKKERLIEAAQQKEYLTEAESVANAVGTALSRELDSLTNIAINNGKEALQEEITSIAQNTIVMETQTIMNGVTARFSKEFSTELKSLSAVLAEYNVPDLLEKVQDSAEKLYNNAKSNIDAFINRRKNNGKEKSKAYETITAVLAIATDIIAPIFEIIIIFLPRILEFIFGKIQEKKREQEVRNAISTQIPSIKRQVREKVAEVLKDNSSKIINDISNKYDAELCKKQAEIEEAMNQVDQGTNTTQNISDCEKGITEVNSLLDALL